jgi:Sec-independent protein secretion pathway component TatC
LLALPVWLLFELGLLAARWLPKKQIESEENQTE